MITRQQRARARARRRAAHSIEYGRLGPATRANYADRANLKTLAIAAVLVTGVWSLPACEDDTVIWEEDTLPAQLYDWQARFNGDLVRMDRDIDGHVGCWAAVADTTLVMCPDGFVTES